MNLDTIHISFSNLFQDGFNSIFFSFFAITIVFTGLVLISFYIALLPKVLNALYGKKLSKGSEAKNSEKSQTSSDAVDVEIALAISTALHLEFSNSSSDQKITWDFANSSNEWKMSGIAHGLTIRNSIPLRRL